MGKRHNRGNQTGLTLIEVTIGIAVVGILMLAAAATFSRNVNAVRHATATTEAAIYLQATMEDLTAQQFDTLLAMNGNQFYDGVDKAHSNYGVELTVFTAEIDLLQVQVELSDLETGRALAKITTLRARD